jgi:hypothetical protein
MSRRALVIAASLLAFGCVATMKVDPVVDKEFISVDDKRPPDSRRERRDSAFSAIAMVGDENINPPALVLLQASLQKHSSGRRKLNLVIDEFRIIDYFPVRIHAGLPTAGLLTKLITEYLIQSKTDWSIVEAENIPSTSDSILCLFAGAINGRQVKIVRHSPYHTSPFAGAIRHTGEFQNAVVESIDKVAIALLSTIDEKQ